MGGGERICGLKHDDDCPYPKFGEAVPCISKVRPNGLLELVPPVIRVLGWGGLFAMGEE